MRREHNMAVKVFDEVLQQEVFVQTFITPEIAEDHPHDQALKELKVEEGDFDDEM